MEKCQKLFINILFNKRLELEIDGKLLKTRKTTYNFTVL